MAKRIDQIDKNFKAMAVSRKDRLWWLSSVDRRLVMRGLGWYRENGKRFNRLPLRAQKIVREDVWTLARSPASARLCFRSDTTHLSVKVTNAELNQMPHMPASGQGGLALYVGEPWRMRPWEVAIPDMKNAHYERHFLQKMTRKMREYTLYLPLYNHLEKLELGFSQGARIEPPSATALRKPVVFYGTSVTQGGCASTAGTDFVSIVGRLLNLDVINLGFSGNGRGEPELAGLVREIDASLFVLDYVGNVGPSDLEKTLPPFYNILRKKHPKTPILLMSMVTFGRISHSSVVRKGAELKRDIMIHFYSKMRKAGDMNLHFVDGSALIHYGADSAYVDGVHPSDGGFRMMAKRLAPFIEMILSPTAS
jgi:lysophospholipase L1-like esterase